MPEKGWMKCERQSTVTGKPDGRVVKWFMHYSCCVPIIKSEEMR